LLTFRSTFSLNSSPQFATLKLGTPALNVVDGNKRTGHAATETFLVLNGMEINASVDEQERVVLAIASGELGRESFVEWLQRNATAS
jgi:hypothetical protein